MNPQKDPLDKALKSWKPRVELSPRFQAEVWQRIADREAESAWTPLRLWLEQAAAVLTRPRYATAFVAAVIILSAGLAQAQFYAHDRSSNGDLQVRYFNSIDPYAKTSR